MLAKFLRSLLMLFIFCLIWQGICVYAQIANYLVPSPLSIFNSWQQHFALIAKQAIPTMIETLLGLTLGTLLGVMLAILLAFSAYFKRWFLPLIIISQALPTFAIAPLLVLWFGYGMSSKIICVVIMIFFPITHNTFEGLRKTPLEWIELARTMNANRWQIFMKVRLPASLPSFFAGLKIAATYAPIGAVIGEWIGSNQGLGYLMLNANARMQISLVFATLFTLVILTLVLYYSISALAAKAVFWHQETI